MVPTLTHSLLLLHYISVEMLRVAPPPPSPPGEDLTSLHLLRLRDTVGCPFDLATMYYIICCCLLLLKLLLLLLWLLS